MSAPARTFADLQREAAFYVRLGKLAMGGGKQDFGPGVFERYEPTATWSRASQVARTWRSHFAWHLANALGWRP